MKKKNLGSILLLKILVTYLVKIGFSMLIGARNSYIMSQMHILVANQCHLLK